MEEKALQVEHWREEFKMHKKRLGRYWRSQLMNTSKEFNDDEGRRTIDTVSDGKGSLIRTARVVKALSKIKVSNAETV